MDDGFRNDTSVPDPERFVRYFLECNLEWRRGKAGKALHNRLQQSDRAFRTDQRHPWTMTTSIFGIDHCIEKKGDEVGKVIGVKMREQNVRDLVPVHSGFDQIHQRAWAEIQND